MVLRSAANFDRRSLFAWCAVVPLIEIGTQRGQHVDFRRLGWRRHFARCPVSLVRLVMLGFSSKSAKEMGLGEYVECLIVVMGARFMLVNGNR